MEILFITDNISLKIPSEEKNRIEIQSSVSLDISKIENYRAVVIDEKILDVKGTLKSIRQSPSDSIALKPVFIFTHGEVKDNEIKCLSDGKTSLQQMTEILSPADEILKLISTLKEFKPENFQISVMLRILRFLYTRAISLEPMIIPTYRFGYSYPLAAAQFPDGDDFRIYEILAQMEQEGFLLGNFYDRIHLCNKCHSAFMNFREVCPICRSANLSVENVIHHFSCGYTAQESKFLQQENLICPKCNKLLRHIGMDYEKPSTVYICHSCQETFQEPSVECFCFYCHNKTPIEEAVSWDIKKYELTPAGANCAIYGIMFSFEDFLRNQVELVDYGSFKKMVALEAERKKRYKRESSVGFFQVMNFQKIYLKIGERKNEIGLEMARIIKDALRKTDAIAVLNESTFLILFLETTAENANIALSRIKNSIENLLINNLSTLQEKFVPEVRINAVNVEEFSLNGLFPD